jgi:hypothetical protein
MMDVTKQFVLSAAARHVDSFRPLATAYEARGILHSEMLAVCSVCDELGVDLIFESGRARGQSTLMLAKYFKEKPVRVLSIDWDEAPWFRPDDDRFACEQLTPYRNVEIHYGDSVKLIPQLVHQYRHKKMAVLLDGPKDQTAIDLLGQVFQCSTQVRVGFIHDMYRGTAHRKSLQSTCERVFFTDDSDYVDRFTDLDGPCLCNPGWRPYWNPNIGTLASYGPTLAVVLPSPNDRFRTVSSLSSWVGKFREPDSLLPVAYRRLLPNTVTKAIRRGVQSVAADALARNAFQHTGGRVCASPQRYILELGMNFLRQNRVDGHYFEFATSAASTFLDAFHAAQARSMYGMHFFRCIPFELAPQPHMDEDGVAAETIAAVSRDTFLETLRKGGMDMERVTCVKNERADTFNDELKERILKPHARRKASFVFLGCELSESVAQALDFITDLLTDGSMLVLDGWFCGQGHPQRGQQRAFHEWCARNRHLAVQEYARYGWHGIAYVVNILA